MLGEGERLRCVKIVPSFFRRLQVSVEPILQSVAFCPNVQPAGRAGEVGSKCLVPFVDQTAQMAKLPVAKTGVLDTLAHTFETGFHTVHELSRAIQSNKIMV